VIESLGSPALIFGMKKGTQHAQRHTRPYNLRHASEGRRTSRIQITERRLPVIMDLDVRAFND